jgi:hypothetical protein
VRAAARAGARAARLAETNEVLAGYVSNLLRFLDQLANSREVQSWLIESPPDVDFRGRLLARVDDFLAAHGVAAGAAPGDGFLQDDVLARVSAGVDPVELLAAVQVLAGVADVTRKLAASLQ